MNINIKTVAKKAGVSTATVSRVLSNKNIVKKSTKNKVKKAIKELGYEINIVARNLRREKTNTIGIIVGDILTNFNSIIAKSVEDITRKHGYNLILCNGGEDPDKELEYLKVLKENRVAGIIINPTNKNVQYINRLIGSGVKIVLVDRSVDGINCTAVVVDNERGAYNIVKFLIDQGYRKIAIISGSLDTTTGKERLNGYLRALNEAGILKNEDMIKIGDFQNRSEYSRLESAYKFTREILSSTNRPEALFTTNMDTTLGSLLAIKDMKLKIPEDIAIVGFDDAEWAKILETPLTTIYQPAYDLGATAADILMKKIEEKATDQDNSLIIRLNTKLIIRESTKIKKLQL